MNIHKGSLAIPSWLGTATLGAVAVAYVLLVFVPNQRAIVELRRQVREKREFVAQSDQLSLANQDLKVQLQRAERMIREWKATSPGPNELSPVFAQVSQRAQATGAQLRRLEPQTGKELTTLRAQSVAVSVEGTFQQVFGFLRGVEELPPTTWMTNVAMQRDGEDRGNVRCELTLTIFADLMDNSDYLAIGPSDN